MIYDHEQHGGDQDDSDLFSDFGAVMDDVGSETFNLSPPKFALICR